MSESLDKSEIRWVEKQHLHNTVLRAGQYPDNATPLDVYSVVNAGYGGYFLSFKNGEFEFVAFTD